MSISISISIYLFIHPSIHPSIYLSIYIGVKWNYANEQMNRDPVKLGLGKLASKRMLLFSGSTFIWRRVTKQTWKKGDSTNKHRGWICHRWFGWCFRHLLLPIPWKWDDDPTTLFGMAKSSDHIVLPCEDPCSPRCVSVAKLKWELHNCPVTIFEFFGRIHSYSSTFQSFSTLGIDQI